MGLVAVLSFATQLATPPAVVPGNRVVLSRDALPGPDDLVMRIGGPLLADEQAFWISQPRPEEYVVVSAWWETPDGRTCEVVSRAQGAGPIAPPPLTTADDCDVRANFRADGEPAGAPRGLDRYLVAVEGDRVVVNVGRPIRGVGSTPQPTRSPLQ